MIILRGFIDEDGSVRDVRVHRGVEPFADQLAVAAFRQWKFRPVLQKDKPVRVEFLLGVPAYIEGEIGDLRPPRAGSR
jgi:TonB family protein